MRQAGRLSTFSSAIIPFYIGDEAGQLPLPPRCASRNFCSGNRYPTVLVASAYCVWTLTVTHTPDDVSELVAAIAVHPQAQMNKLAKLDHQSSCASLHADARLAERDPVVIVAGNGAVLRVHSRM